MGRNGADNATPCNRTASSYSGPIPSPESSSSISRFMPQHLVPCPVPARLCLPPLPPNQLPQPLTSHPIPIAIQAAVPLPQQLLRLRKRADLLAGGLGPAGLGSLRASGGRA